MPVPAADATTVVFPLTLIALIVLLIYLSQQAKRLPNVNVTAEERITRKFGRGEAVEFDSIGINVIFKFLAFIALPSVLVVCLYLLDETTQIGGFLCVGTIFAGIPIFIASCATKNYSHISAIFWGIGITALFVIGFAIYVVTAVPTL